LSSAMKRTQSFRTDRTYEAGSRRLPGSYRIDRHARRHCRRPEGFQSAERDDLGPPHYRVRHSDGFSLINVRRERDGDSADLVFPSRCARIRPPCTVRTYDFSTTSDSRVGMCLLRYPADTSIAVVRSINPTFTLPLGAFARRLRQSRHRLSGGVEHAPARQKIAAAEFRIPPLPDGLYRLIGLALTQNVLRSGHAPFRFRYYSDQGPPVFRARSHTPS